MSNGTSQSPETLEPAAASSTEPQRLVTRSVSVDSAEPDSFLRLFHGGPRGFWARGHAWVAHAGAVSTLRVEADNESSDRFSIVRKRAAAALSSSSPADAGVDHPPRFYGGFAFRDDQPAVGPWEQFPSALFMLPEFELEFAGGELTLRGRVLLGPWDDGSGAERTIERRLDTLAEALGRTAGLGSTKGVRGGVRGRAPSNGDREAWDTVVDGALAGIDDGAFSKVVLARTLDVDHGTGRDSVDVLMTLWADNPRAHVFLFEPKTGVTLVGAAPETVATVYGTSFHATAVAGSAPLGATPEETAQLAEGLFASRKDQLEHRFAVEDMVERLRAIALDVRAEWEPHVITLSSIQHLETRIRATLPPGCTVLGALAALHPTPAVCGLPRDSALQFIHEEEQFDRGWYAGPVGWFDSEGSGVFAPALRSGVGQGGRWRLFAGAGIVAGSQSSLEWDETGIKFEPVLRALATGADE